MITVLDPVRCRVKADTGLMEQVIVNLAVNARHPMPQGGILTITTENMTLEEDQCALIPGSRPGQFVCLSIADAGAGMDQEITQHRFEPFFTTKGPEDGTGLGLFVVCGIVTQHEGWIQVHSEVGQGWTFKVYLPALSAAGESDSQEEIPLPQFEGHGEGILLVEDDETARGATTRMLGGTGYVVFEAATVREALEVHQREQGGIQLVYTDVVLPDGSGLRLVDQLLSRDRDLRVLVSSGWIGDKSQWSVVRDRGFAFLQKPYTLDQLLRVTRETIGRAEAEDGKGSHFI